MATHYSTITLSEEYEEDQSNRRFRRVAVAVMSLFALAGVLALLAQPSATQVNAVDDHMMKGLMCTMPDMQPKWAGELEGDQTQFWSRACYHSFRCCTTVDSSCLASGGYGEKCQTCLSAASPQLIRQPCLQYIGNNGYTREAAMSGKTPYLPTGEPADGRLTWAEWIQSEGVAGSRWIGAFMNENGEIKNCYNQPAGGSPEADRYAAACWKAVDWCNLQCPRDAPTFQHQMCKHCISQGFIAAKANTQTVDGDTYIGEIPLKIGK